MEYLLRGYPGSSLHNPKIPRWHFFGLASGLSLFGTESLGVLALAACIVAIFSSVSLKNPLRMAKARQSPARATQMTTRATPLLAFGQLSKQQKRMLGKSATSEATAAPPGMVHISGGEFSMGSDDPMFADARPWHRVYVDAFWMNKTEVTNQQFTSFVRAAGYVTVAERKPDPKDYPTARPENLVAGSLVFDPPNQPVSLDNPYQWWSYVAGANWRHPEGPNSNLRGRSQHPVVQVAYEDAQAYCTWAGSRLPTEAEFEFAARGGYERKPYAWGDQFKPEGKFMANTFQGNFPNHNTGEDGYITTAPVGSFPANRYGLYDMAGNVWEWTSDWYRADYYQTLLATGVARNPQGPPDSFDPAEPGIPKRVQRGGSFLCSEQYCTRYKVGARGKGAADTGTNHVGFRCVRE